MNLSELEHSRGVAWTAHILLDGVYAGTAEDQGMGGDVTFEPHRITSDRLELVWEETVARATEVGRALVTLDLGQQAGRRPQWYGCDIFAYLDTRYEGIPMTLLHAYNLMTEDYRQYGLVD
jgi:hypothetical protein